MKNNRKTTLQNHIESLYRIKDTENMRKNKKKKRKNKRKRGGGSDFDTEKAKPMQNYTSARI